MNEFVIVDVEALGAPKKENRIIEIGIVVSDGYQIKETFSSLIDPQKEVTPFVENLTGITYSMLKGKPLFQELSVKIKNLLENRIFVAHNVSFDYNLVLAECLRSGISFQLPRLCTVKLSRKIFPGLLHYNLASVAAFLNIDMKAHHRALDDALAATEILHQAIAKTSLAQVLKLTTHKKVKWE